MEVLIFKVDNRFFGIPIDSVKEIMTAANVTPIPNAVRFVEGTFIIRDMTITVLNMQKYLNGDSENTGVFILTVIHDENIALHIDEVVTSLEVTNLVPADAMMKNGEHPVIDSAFKFEDSIVLNLNLEKIFMHVFEQKG